jgi:hypothetical protein
MPERSSKERLSNLDHLAVGIVDETIGDESESVVESDIPEKNPHAAALGRLGGIKGGPARALRLSAERRSEIARKAADARWHRTQGSEGSEIEQ